VANIAEEQVEAPVLLLASIEGADNAAQAAA
jgi:hypothetical protein